MLSQALRKTRAKGYIGQNHADADIVNRPRGAARRPEPLEVERAEEILAAVRGVDPWDAAVPLALGMSLRREEVIGLGWSHVDLDAGRLLVERTLTYADGELHYGPPKSEAGERELEIPGFVADALRRHRAAQNERRLLIGEGWPLGGGIADHVVERGCGEPWHPSTFSTYWRRWATANGFAGTTFHDLRHGTGALLLASGISSTVALEIMGHSALEMLRRYQGVSRALKREAADKLDELLRPKI
ncbi:MAG: tyrosine-type recombinase/integrase [Actinomycetota bacterium]